MTYKVMTITPKLAEQWLETGTKNRNIRRGHVAFLRHMMEADEWMLSGQPIKFSGSLDKDTAQLLDGQHRLTAVVQSGVSIKQDVIDGLPQKAFEVLDTGANRAPSDLLAMDGVISARVLASSVRLCIGYEEGGKTLSNFIADDGRRARLRRFSNHEIREYVTNNPRLVDTMAYYHRIRPLLRGAAAPVAAMYLFSRASMTDTEKFVTRFETGTKLGATSPINVLRGICISQLTRKRTTLHRTEQVFAYWVKAWSAYRGNKRVKHSNELLGYQEGDEKIGVR